jgi:hypothetical protein
MVRHCTSSTRSAFTNRTEFDYYQNSDTPLALAIAAMEAIPKLTGTEETGFNFTLYTGRIEDL